MRLIRLGTDIDAWQLEELQQVVEKFKGNMEQPKVEEVEYLNTEKDLFSDINLEDFEVFEIVKDQRINEEKRRKELERKQYEIELDINKLPENLGIDQIFDYALTNRIPEEAKVSF